MSSVPWTSEFGVFWRQSGSPSPGTIRLLSRLSRGGELAGPFLASVAVDDARPVGVDPYEDPFISQVSLWHSHFR